MVTDRHLLLLIVGAGLASCTFGEGAGRHESPRDVDVVLSEAGTDPSADAEIDDRASAAGDGGRAAADGAPDAGVETREPATWDRVRRLVRSEDHARALAALERLPEGERGTGRARYLRGRLLEELGRVEAALEAFGLEEAAFPESVRRDLELRRAGLLARAERCHEARPLLLKLGKRPGTDGARARTLAAECALELGDHEAAARELKALAARGGRDIDPWKVRRLLAEALAGDERPEEARETLHGLLVRYPEHREAERAEARLRQLGGEVSFTTAQRFVRARRLLARRRFEAALTELEAAGRPARRPQLARWLHLKGTALYRTRHHYAEAAEVLAEAARLGGPTAIDDEFHAARALSRADRDDEAIAAYLTLVKEHPNHGRAAEAEYLAAWLDIHHERPRGEVRMHRFLKGPRARRDPDLRREAIWYLAFRAFERGKHRRAVGLFEQYSRTGRTGLVRGRGLYWKARAHEALGQRDEAVETMRQAIGVEPLHWYALLARERLIKLGEEPGPPFPDQGDGGGRASKARPPLPPIALPDDVRFYASLGLDDDAEERLRAQEGAIRAAAPPGRAVEALVRAYHQIGAYRRAYRWAASRRDELDRRPGSSNRWVWDGAYPRPYEDLVREIAGEHRVEPAHVYATMRQESGYRPRVVSHAGAVGLLQMLPATARGMAEGLGVEFRREQLFDPEWNLRYGIAEIAELGRAFDGNLPLTIAAYNAGAHRVRRWLDESGEMELDRFVERIPFNETRGYVRRVTSHYARYRYLEDPSQPWPPHLPERVGPEAEAPAPSSR